MGVVSGNGDHRVEEEVGHVSEIVQGNVIFAVPAICPSLVNMAITKLLLNRSRASIKELL